MEENQVVDVKMDAQQAPVVPAAPVVNEKANSLVEFFKANNMGNIFTLVDLKNEAGTQILQGKMQAQGQILPMAVLLDNSVYILLQVQVAPQVATTPERVAALATYINDMNNQYRMFKFTVAGDGSFMLNCTLTAENETFNPALLNAILGEIVKFLESEYRTIMSNIWKA